MPENNYVEIIELCKQRKNLGLRWNELAEKCFTDFGIEISGENLRQTYVRYKRKNGEFESKENKPIDEIIEIKKERIKLRDQKTEITRLLTKVARFETIKEYIINSARQISQQKPILNKNRKFYVTASTREGVLLISDWHSSLEVDNFINKFNREEFLKRVDKLIHKTIEYGKLHDIKKLHVVNLNDLVAGIIHYVIKVTSNEDIISQIMNVSELLAEMLAKLAEHFPKVVFYSVIDNHSRVNADKSHNRNKENFARLIPWYLKERVRDIDNLLIDTESIIDDEIAVFEVCGANCFAVHGHNDKPETIAKNLTLMVKRGFPDYIFMSHYHHNIENEVNGIEVIANQSLVGTDEYAKNYRLTSKSCQKFMVFDSGIGRLATYNIPLA